MKTLIIDDSDNNVLKFDLRDILAEIKEGANYIWSIENLSINYLNVPDAQFEVSNPDFQLIHLIEEREGKYPINWNDLLKISKNNIQVIDGIFYGYNTHTIIISAFDSSYWRVSTDDDDLILRLKARFKSTRLDNPK